MATIHEARIFKSNPMMTFKNDSAHLPCRHNGFDAIYQMILNIYIHNTQYTLSLYDAQLNDAIFPHVNIVTLQVCYLFASAKLCKIVSYKEIDQNCTLLS